MSDTTTPPAATEEPKAGEAAATAPDTAVPAPTGEPVATAPTPTDPSAVSTSPSAAVAAGTEEKKDTDFFVQPVRPYVPPTPSIFAVSAPTETKLLTSTTITQYPPAPTYEHPPLRNAELTDLVEGNTIYVRGRRAVIRRLDFPLIFWTSEGEEVEKHRSFHADPNMFKVEAVGVSGGSGEEEKKAAATTAGSSGSDEKDLSKESAAKALSAAVHHGHKVVEYKSIKKREVIHCDAKYPASVYVEECDDCSIFVPDKVSAITLVNCHNITIRFISVIAKVELIRSTGSIIICGSTCATYTLDGSSDTRIVFAAKDITTPITWITASSTGTRLIGRVEESASSSASDEKEVKDELAPHTGDLNHEIVIPAASPETTPAGEAVIPQYTTSFNAGTFSPTTLLVREGMAGYVSPAAAAPSSA